jgi:hypothetical protein
MNELKCEEEMKKKKKKRNKTKEEMLKLEVGTDCLFVVIIFSFTDAAGPTFSICQFVLFTLNGF